MAELHDTPLDADDPADKQTLGRMFRALRHRNFRLFWTSQVLSLAGTWMQVVAQGWLVYRLTTSPLMLGLVSFVGLLPVVPVSLLAGVISDRFPRRTLILITEIVLMLQAFLMALLAWLDIIEIWHVIVLSFVLGAAASLEQPARLAFVADIVGPEDLTNAVALNAAVNNSARIVGPAAAGIVVAATGEAGCFLVNGITYLAVIAALLGMRMAPQVRRTPAAHASAGAASRPAKNAGGAIVEGFHYVWKTQPVRVLMLIVGVASLFTLPYVTLMPVFAGEVLDVGAQGLGWLMTTLGAGAIVGSMTVASLRKGHRGRWLVIGNILGSLMLIAFCLSDRFAPSLILIFLVGLTNATRNTLANSLLQLNTLSDYHGRVMSLYNLLFSGMSRVGALLIGGLADVTSISWAVGLGAAIGVGWGLVVLWRMPSVWRLK